MCVRFDTGIIVCAGFEWQRVHPWAAALDLLHSLWPELLALDACLGLLGAGVIEARGCTVLEGHLSIVVDPLALPNLLTNLRDGRDRCSIGSMWSAVP